MTVHPIDYTDRFSIDVDATATPEQWARAMFGDTPSAGELLIWTGMLGLRLSRGRSPETIAGWHIATGDTDWICLEATSWLLAANLVVHVTPETVTPVPAAPGTAAPGTAAPGTAAPGTVTLTTAVHYNHPVARLWWPPLSTIHRTLVPRVLRAAAARIQGPAPRLAHGSGQRRTGPDLGRT